MESSLRNKYLLFPTYRVCSGNRGDVQRLTITYLNVWYLSPVRGSRTFAWAEKTMKETLILGLKGGKIFTQKCENLLKLRNMCLSVSSGLILKNITSVPDTRGTPRMAVNVSLADGDKSHKLHSGK